MSFVQSFTVQPLSYRESRRDQRLRLPRLHAVIAGYVSSTVNWSLGGLLLQGPMPPGARPGAVVSGRLAGEARSGPETVPFAGYVVRSVAQPAGFALRFLDGDAQVVEFLEQCLRRRLARRGR